MMTTAITALMITLAPAMGTTVDVPTSPQTLPACAEEDGNTDGLPCLWVDPDTGRGFYVDSANYR